jgi:hypothetical protein
MKRRCADAARKLQIPISQAPENIETPSAKASCRVATSWIFNLEVSMDVAGWNLEFLPNGFTDFD